MIKARHLLKTVCVALFFTWLYTPPTLATSDAFSNSGKLICYYFNEPTQAFHSASWCASSVLPPQGKFSYGPGKLFQNGAWCEGVKGYGIGQIIKLAYKNGGATSLSPSYDRIVIRNGYDKSAKAFYDNSRVKKISIRTDTGARWSTTLKDKRGPQTIRFGYEINPQSLTIKILSVYRGRKYKDTCLSGLSADFGM